MVRNIKGGKKHKKNKNHTKEMKKKEIIYAGEEQVYGKVIKKLGGNILLVECTDGITRQGIIPGKYRKRVWFNIEDIVLITLNALGSSKETGTIEIKYEQEEKEQLEREQLLKFKKNELIKEVDMLDISFGEMEERRETEEKEGEKIKPQRDSKFLKLLEEI